MKCGYLVLFSVHFTIIFLITCVFACAGDIQIGLMDKKGQLEVEVIRARGLTPKPGSKSLPGKHIHSTHFLFSTTASVSLVSPP